MINPLFLDFFQEKREFFSHGVVHSFDGTLQQAQSILSLQGLCIGEGDSSCHRHQQRCHALVLEAVVHVMCIPRRNQRLLLEDREEPAGRCAAPS